MMKNDFGSMPRDLLDSHSRALERHIVLEREERVAAVDELKAAVQGLREELDAYRGMLQSSPSSVAARRSHHRQRTTSFADGGLVRQRTSTVDGRLYDPAGQVQQKMNQTYAELEVELDRRGKEISERLDSMEIDNKLAELEVSLHEKAKGLQKVQLVLQQNLGPSVDKLKHDLAQASSELRHDLQELRGTFLASCLQTRVQNIRTATYVMNFYGLAEEDRRADYENLKQREAEMLSTVKTLYQQSKRDQVSVMRTISHDLLSKMDLAPAQLPFDANS